MPEPMEHTKTLALPDGADWRDPDGWVQEQARQWVADLQRDGWVVTGDGVTVFLVDDPLVRSVILRAHVLPVVHWLDPWGGMVHALPNGLEPYIRRGGPTADADWERVTCDTCRAHRPPGGTGAPEGAGDGQGGPHGAEQPMPGPQHPDTPTPAGVAPCSDVPQTVEVENGSQVEGVENGSQRRAQWDHMVGMLELVLTEEREECQTWLRILHPPGRYPARPMTEARVWACTQLLDALQGLTPPLTSGDIIWSDLRRLQDRAALQDRVNQTLANAHEALRAATPENLDNVRRLPFGGWKGTD